jgi:hypothetical protein
MSDVLIEYVSLVLERIKTKRDVKSNFGNKFDINQFKKLDNINVMLEYASMFLDELGRGTSRAAFTLSGKYVLKIALNEKGIAQNETEVQISNNGATKDIVTKIYGAGPNKEWLISDIVKELSSSKEFESLTGAGWTDFRIGLRALLLKKDVKDFKDLDAQTQQFCKKIAAAARKTDLLYGDIVQLDHWGKTPDSRLVLLDYGFTEGVWEKHYKKPNPEIAPEEDSTRKD